VKTAQEQKIEPARAERLTRAREFAAGSGLSKRVGEHLAGAVDAEPGVSLPLIDQFPLAMRGAAAAIFPRAAHGPDHERGAREHAPAARLASRSRDHEAAHWLAEAGQEITRADDRRAQARARQADDRAHAARSAGCPCGAGPGEPCRPAGDHLARYLRAGHDGSITRESLNEVIGGLDVIAPHVLIQPPGERAAQAAGAQPADQLVQAQMDAGMSSSTAAMTTSQRSMPARHGNWRAGA
jgi:hypothetical protein